MDLHESSQGHSFSYHFIHMKSNSITHAWWNYSGCGDQVMWV